MGVLDSLLINHDLISKGLHYLADKKYILVKDKDQKVICLTYNMEPCNTLIEHYLKDQSINNEDVIIEKISLKTQGDKARLLPYKLIVLDNKLRLYKEVVEHAKQHTIKGYKEGHLPSRGLNKFETL